MKIILAYDKKITSRAIQLYTWSRWHHGGVILGDKVIEARAKEGVVISSLEEFKGRYEDYIILEIPHVGDYQQRLYNQVGKPYDWGAIFQFVARGDWSNEDKWFCFELIAYASGVFNSEYIDRVTATHLLMVSKT